MQSRARAKRHRQVTSGMKTALSKNEIDALLEAAHTLSEATSIASRPQRNESVKKALQEAEKAMLEAMLEQLRDENAQLKAMLIKMQASEAKQKV